MTALTPCFRGLWTASYVPESRVCVCVCVRVVRELVHCACEMAGRAPGDHVTFGEFAVLVTELRELYRRQRSVGRPSVILIALDSTPRQ